MQTLKLQVDFYADGFKTCQIEMDLEVDKTLPKCECNMRWRDGHHCERGMMIESMIKAKLLEGGIEAFPEIIRAKKIHA
jgi:hypothetical protein